MKNPTVSNKFDFEQRFYLFSKKCSCVYLGRIIILKNHHCVQAATSRRIEKTLDLSGPERRTTLSLECICRHVLRFNLCHIQQSAAQDISHYHG
jgi:hypothetical protein